jgi:dihydroorotate dehydrogenase (NAD+) catalytic subunit
MLNSIGLQNVGVRAFVSTKLPKLRKYSVPVVANVFGYAIEDYLDVVRVLESTEGIAAYELNVSCPNTKEGGIFFSSDPALLASLITRVRPVSTRPLIVKLSPNVASIVPFAKAAEDSGADAVSMVNTFIGLAIDIETRRPRIGASFGGLSGPAIKPLALRMVYEASKAVKIPVIGLGGIVSGEDAAEFLIAGASAVQVGTGSFLRPDAPLQVAQQLATVLRKMRVPDVRSLTGTLNMF